MKQSLAKKRERMKKTFKELGLNEQLLKGVTDLGFENPTQVQAESIPKILDKKDLIVMSKTGSGKTGAFGLPLLQSIDANSKAPSALILTPTRELAVQVESDIRQAGKYTQIKSTAVYGQHNMNKEIKALKSGVNLVVGTPGRVQDHIKRRNLNTKNIQFLVLDEADRMLDMGFIDQVVDIIKRLPKSRNTLLFSATMPPEIQHICMAYMKDPISIELETDTKTVDLIDQMYYKVQKDEKRKWLNNILKLEQPDSCMIFCNTRYEVDRICTFLTRKNYMAEGLHGANSQAARSKTMNRFKAGEIQILVATDVAARGLHIDDMALVINYDLPEMHDSYVHRIGRTGRAGNTGKAISLVTTEEFMLMYEIEEHVGVLIEEMPLPEQKDIDQAVKNYQGKWKDVKPKQTHHKSHDKHKHDRKKTDHTKHKATKNKSPNPKQYTDKTVGSKTKTSGKSYSKPYNDKVKPTATIPKQPTVKPSKPKLHKSDAPKVKREKRYVKGIGEMTFIVKDQPEKKPSLFKRIFKGSK